MFSGASGQRRTFRYIHIDERRPSFRQTHEQLYTFQSDSIIQPDALAWQISSTMIVVRNPSDAPHLHSANTSVTEDVAPMTEFKMEPMDMLEEDPRQYPDKEIPMKPVYENPLDRLLEEVQKLHERDLRVDSLIALSYKLQAEFEERLQSESHCMLPSHNYTLPNGREHGTYLALEVGGSTLRVALLELNGRTSTQPVRICRTVASNIDSRVRNLKGLQFFDWIAVQVQEIFLGDGEARDHMPSTSQPIPMGIAWSFPIESVSRPLLRTVTTDKLNSQTSIRSGNIIGMGKGFHCSTYKGSDLGDLIAGACQRLVSMTDSYR